KHKNKSFPHLLTREGQFPRSVKPAVPFGAIADAFAERPDVRAAFDIDHDAVELHRPRCRRIDHGNDSLVGTFGPCCPQPAMASANPPTITDRRESIRISRAPIYTL